MTSSPYLVRKSSDDGTRLGDVWWRKFIPEDWEIALDWATDGRWYETKVEDLVSICLVNGYQFDIEILVFRQCMNIVAHNSHPNTFYFVRRTDTDAWSHLLGLDRSRHRQ